MEDVVDPYASVAEMNSAYYGRCTVVKWEHSPGLKVYISRMC